MTSARWCCASTVSEGAAHTQALPLFSVEFCDYYGYPVIEGQSKNFCFLVGKQCSQCSIVTQRFDATITDGAVSIHVRDLIAKGMTCLQQQEEAPLAPRPNVP